MQSTNRIKQFIVYWGMLIFAVFVAGGYGAIHDQISYSFSPEYFTQFKFKQFEIPWAYDTPRIGAAYVGMLATWWMGILVFMFLGFFGYLFKTPKQMMMYLAKSFLVVVFVALCTGLAGLGYGYFKVNETNIILYAEWIWPGVENRVQFIRVGFMHNASYLGGLTGLLAGIIYLVVAKARLNRREHSMVCE